MLCTVQPAGLRWRVCECIVFGRVSTTTQARGLHGIPAKEIILLPSHWAGHRSSGPCIQTHVLQHLLRLKARKHDMTAWMGSQILLGLADMSTGALLITILLLPVMIERQVSLPAGMAAFRISSPQRQPSRMHASALHPSALLPRAACPARADARSGRLHARATGGPRV
jgi:hypothetical protein